MDKLRGRGTTFSTSGKAWFPFQGNPKLAARNAKLYRMRRAGTLGPTDKQAARDLAQAVRDGKIPC